MVERRNARGPGVESRRFSRYVWAPCVNVVGLVVDKTNGRVRIENVNFRSQRWPTTGPAARLRPIAGRHCNGDRLHSDGEYAGRYERSCQRPLRISTAIMCRAGQDVPLLDAYALGARAQELIVLPESPNDQGVGRGIAEAVMCSIAPAISNALRDATGHRFTSLPITPEKILKALQS